MQRVAVVAGQADLLLVDAVVAKRQGIEAATLQAARQHQLGQQGGAQARLAPCHLAQQPGRAGGHAHLPHDVGIAAGQGFDPVLGARPAGQALRPFLP